MNFSSPRVASTGGIKTLTLDMRVIAKNYIKAHSHRSSKLCLEILII